MAGAERIYKICRQGEYDKAVSEGVFTGSPDDISDGFIHFSTKAQVLGTLAKHFAGEHNLHLLEVGTAPLGKTLVWEPSRDGELFPHLYGPLDMAGVITVRAVDWDGAVHIISGEDAHE